MKTKTFIGVVTLPNGIETSTRLYARPTDVPACCVALDLTEEHEVFGVGAGQWAVVRWCRTFGDACDIAAERGLKPAATRIIKSRTLRVGGAR